MTQPQIIIFVCEHGAAKSVIAATYFNKIAHEENLSLYAIARGTNPDEELSTNAIMGLREDGLTPTESIPQKLLLADVESAWRIITFCELPDEYHDEVDTEQWDDIPPVSVNYAKSRDAIVERLESLTKKLR